MEIPRHGAGPAGLPRDPLAGLPLAAPTPAGWAEVALGDLDALLSDHAHCEHKAASTALALIARYPEHAVLVRPMMALCHEELHHFRQVLDLLEARGRSLGRPPRDPYARALRDRACREPDGLGALGDQLLVAAFVEARSCERFRLLAVALAERRPGDALGRFYQRLAEAEGRHWEMFRDLARAILPPERVARRLERLARIEAEIVAARPLEPRMH